MKKWTVVIEVEERLKEGVANDVYYSQAQINQIVSDAFEENFPAHCKFRIMETIPAPYGPQHPGGVFIAEMKCICRKGSSFVNPNCKATVHHP